MKFLKGLVFCFCIVAHGIWAEVVISDSLKELNLSVKNAELNAKSPVGQQQQRKWIKARVQYRAINETFYLECQSPHWKDVLVVCRYEDGSLYQFPITGALFDFTTRSISHKNFLFPLPSQQRQFDIYIGLADPNISEFSIMIRSSKDLLKYSLAEYFLLGFYYGILVLVALYNLMLYLRGNLKLHLYYVLYILGCICMSFKEDGIAFHYVWSSWPHFNLLLVTYVAKPIFMVSFIWYASSFLNVSKNLKWGSRPMYMALAVYVPVYFYAVDHIRWQWVSEALFVGIFLYIYFVSITMSLRSKPFASFFTLGFTVVLASMVINFFRQLGWIAPTIFTVYIYNFSIILEVIIFSWALAERIRQIQRERLRNHEELVVQLHKNDELQKVLIVELEDKRMLQDKVNRELEQKVKERTLELEDANTRLQAFAARLDQVNAALDIDNHELKKEIKREKVSRVFHEKLSFEAFCKLYPSEEACLKEIYDLKWTEGYRCKKCGNNKSSIIQGWQRKKCSKCGSIESTTSHTLYHALKFPLNKAFYITYIEVAGIRHTYEELSEMLDLRKPTVWAFKHKVMQRMEETHYRNVKGWKEMILDKE